MDWDFLRYRFDNVLAILQWFCEKFAELFAESTVEADLGMIGRQYGASDLGPVSDESMTKLKEVFASFGVKCQAEGN